MTDRREVVLVVDDEPDICWALRMTINGLGFRAAVTGNARDALRLVTQTPLRMAFVDAKLPDLEGIDLIARIHEVQPRLPVVMISGYFDKDNDKVQAWIRERRICAFIGKPFLLDQIREAIRKVK